MKIIERTVLAVFGAAILLAFHQLVALLFMEHGWKGLDSSAWASWVQAVGSIAAIYGAFSIASRQHKKDLRLQEKQVWLQEQSRFKIVKAILDRIGTRFVGLTKARERSEFWIATEDDIEKLRNAARLLEGLPPFDMPDPELLVLCLSIQSRARELCDDLDAELTSLLNLTSIRPPDLERDIRDFRAHLNRAKSKCDHAITARKVLLNSD